MAEVERNCTCLEKCLNVTVDKLNFAIPKFDKDIDTLKDDVGLLKVAEERKTDEHRSIPEVRATCVHEWETRDGIISVFHSDNMDYLSCVRCGFACEVRVFK